MTFSQGHHHILQCLTVITRDPHELQPRSPSHYSVSFDCHYKGSSWSSAKVTITFFSQLRHVVTRWPCDLQPRSLSLHSSVSLTVNTRGPCDLQPRSLSSHSSVRFDVSLQDVVTFSSTSRGHHYLHFAFVWVWDTEHIAISWDDVDGISQDVYTTLLLAAGIHALLHPELWVLQISLRMECTACNKEQNRHTLVWTITSQSSPCPSKINFSISVQHNTWESSFWALGGGKILLAKMHWWNASSWQKRDAYLLSWPQFAIPVAHMVRVLVPLSQIPGCVRSVPNLLFFFTGTRFSPAQEVRKDCQHVFVSN